MEKIAIHRLTREREGYHRCLIMEIYDSCEPHCVLLFHKLLSQYLDFMWGQHTLLSFARMNFWDCSWSLLGGMRTSFMFSTYRALLGRLKSGLKDKFEREINKTNVCGCGGQHTYYMFYVFFIWMKIKNIQYNTR